MHAPAQGGRLYNNGMLTVEPYPLLDLRVFRARFPRPLGKLAPAPELLRLLSAGAPSPLSADGTVREAVRRFLRQRGFKPTGRSKPASEYLRQASQEGRLASINLAVDGCNAVSLHSGLPISVIDEDQSSGPWRIGVAAAGDHYAFNASGQTIDVGHLLCLFDARGPCANAVKDAQRTKTGPQTRTVLCLIWGTTDLPGRAEAAEAWCRSLFEAAGARTETVFP